MKASGQRRFATARVWCAGSNHPFLTQKERDIETGLGYFGARYYASTQGRFASSDAFWKDSNTSTPQSWNKYAYARNNPLKYFDPTGEKATVTIQTDEEHKQGKITVKASIALWTKDGSKLSKEDLQKTAAAYKEQIEKGWNGQYEQNGITYTVETTVDVQVYDSERDAHGSGAQNILEVSNGPLSNGHDSETDRRFGAGPDTGRWNNNGMYAAHEFGHLLGVKDRFSGPELLNQNNYDPVQKANANDYGWTFGGAINEHRESSRPVTYCCPYPGVRATTRTGQPQSRTSTREFVGIGVWWNR